MSGVDDNEDEKVERRSEKNEVGNPLYCSYVDGVYTYSDPKTLKDFSWDDNMKQWKPKSSRRRTEAERDILDLLGDNNDSNGQQLLSNASWFDSISATAQSPTDDLPSNGRGGFRNPNYDSSLQSSENQPRRFYYAALSPSEMGVNEPLLFLSPDDQVNNNTVSPPPEDDEDDDVEDDPSPATSRRNLQCGAGLENRGLPLGWEKHEDSSGPYYWHIKSGTIQREPPTWEECGTNPALLIPGSLSSTSVVRSQTIGSHLSHSTSFGLGSSPSRNQVKREIGKPKDIEKRKSWSQFLAEDEGKKEIFTMADRAKSESSLRFGGVSLGSLSISEENLTPERSSRAVSKVIAELTSQIGVKGSSPTALEVAGRIWGGGSELYLELDEAHLRVKTKDRDLVVGEQAIHSIRVWGVGRDDPRDFAYVAREKTTRQFLCHVFRLEMNARPLASALRDACKRIMIERQQKQKRPTTLPTGTRKRGTPATGPTFFPTPMDEPRKVIKAFYLGTRIVTKATGMETLNTAIDSLRDNHPIPVNISVAPSVLLICTEEPENPKVNIEIRVRYLSFMGIGRDIETCGVIVHTARDDFQAHCFLSSPSSAALAKAIEAACVLRYQKCLDAHHLHNASGDEGGEEPGSGSQPPNDQPTSSGTPSSGKLGTNLAAAFKNVLASFGRSMSVEEKS